jgi:hypothetical protein
MDQCTSITKKGTQCKNKISKNCDKISDKCHIHNKCTTNYKIKKKKKPQCQAHNCTKNGNYTNQNGNFCKKHVHQYKLEKPEECPICMNDLKDEKEPLSCGHWVHKNCILQWKDQCPVCRAKLKLSKEERQKFRIHQQEDQDIHEVNRTEFLMYLDYLRNNDLLQFFNYMQDLGMIYHPEDFDMLLLEYGL